MEFPRPPFDPASLQTAPWFDFTDLIREQVTALAKRETEAVVALLDIAALDETKPGIMVSTQVTQVQDTYVLEQTVAFDESVPRGLVRYAPLPEGWLKP